MSNITTQIVPKVKTSTVWRFLIKSEAGAICKICNRDVKSGGKGGGTTNLKNHLKRNHAGNKEVKVHLFSNDDTPNKEKANTNCAVGNNESRNLKLASMPLVASTSTFLSTDTDLPQYDSTLLASPTSPAHPPFEAENRFCNQIGSIRESRIDRVFNRIKSFEEGGSKAGEITNAILFLIAKDNLPFQTVDNEGFTNLMRTVVPLYSVPGRKSITKKMEEKYHYLSTCETQKLETIDYFSITADIWSDVLNTVSYLGMTVHYEFEKELKSTTIGITELTERHTSDVIGKWMKDIITEWHINDEKIIVFVTDNASNMKKAVKDTFGASRHISCFAHSINLVAMDTMDFSSAVTLCTKVKSIVTFFKQSIIAANELRKATDLKLIQSVETRWNSTFTMLQRFVLLSREVGTILLSIPGSPAMLTAIELQLATEIIEILSPLEKMTKEVCGERYVIASKIIPLLNCFKHKMQSIRDNLKTPVALSLLDRLQQSITSRFGQIEHNSIMAVSTILDPRYKKMHFNQNLACSNAINRIAKWMRQIDETNISGAVSRTDFRIQTNLGDNDDNLWSFHDNLLKIKTVNSGELSQDVIPTDLKHYLNQPMIQRQENPMHYWLTQCESIYPTLSIIAKKYLSIVATSVPSERLFSKAGNILTEARSRLSPIHLQHLLFLNSLSAKEWQLKLE